VFSLEGDDPKGILCIDSINIQIKFIHWHYLISDFILQSNFTKIRHQQPIIFKKITQQTIAISS
jgi:hypothetical protein